MFYRAIPRLARRNPFSDFHADFEFEFIMSDDVHNRAVVVTLAVAANKPRAVSENFDKTYE
jgi:hypothetical protein